MKKQDLTEKVTSKELLNADNSNHFLTEILSSLDLGNPVIREACDKGEYEVELLINGQKVPAKVYNLIVNDLEKHIEQQAVILNEQRYGKLREQGERFAELTQKGIERLEDMLEFTDEEVKTANRLFALIGDAKFQNLFYKMTEFCGIELDEDNV